MRTTAFVLFLLLLAPGLAAAQTADAPCVDGRAGGFPCRNVDLLGFLPIGALGGGPATELNDIWGWTDPQTGREYALVGRSDGVAIVDVSSPTAPVYVGSLPTHTFPSPWRDVKVFENTLLVVSEANGHGLQLFDLTQVRDVASPPVMFFDYTHYAGFGNAHNIVVNEDTGFAYAVGATRIANDQMRTCGGGLHMIDVRDPANPTFAGCFAEPSTGRAGTGYTHDAQCVIYNGPDADYQGRELCFAYNETAVVVADVTDKSAPFTISTARYPTSQYVHQGWLTDDHAFVFQDDELDEARAGLVNTRTLVWDMTDLDDPILAAEYFGESTSIDHNQYVRGPLNFQANYTSGLRILDVSTPAAPVEVGFFDTYLPNDGVSFDGAWSTYPYFDSGVVVVSSISEGLFVLMPTGPAAQVVADEDPVLPGAFALSAAYPNPFNPATSVTLTVGTAGPVRVAVYDVLGREVARLHDGPLGVGAHAFTWTAGGQPSGSYFVRAEGPGGTATTGVTLAK